MVDGGDAAEASQWYGTWWYGMVVVLWNTLLFFFLLFCFWWWSTEAPNHLNPFAFLITASRPTKVSGQESSRSFFSVLMIFFITIRDQILFLSSCYLRKPSTKLVSECTPDHSFFFSYLESICSRPHRLIPSATLFVLSSLI